MLVKKKFFVLLMLVLMPVFAGRMLSGASLSAEKKICSDRLAAQEITAEATEQPSGQSEVNVRAEDQTHPEQNKAAQTQQQSVRESEGKKEEGQEVQSQRPPAETRNGITGWLDPWKKTLELSYVVTGGNTLSSSFSFGANLSRSPDEKNTYALKIFLLRSHSTTVNRKALGTEESFVVEEEKTRNLSAENYILSGQYDHRVSGRLTTNLGFVWDRNKFSGVMGRALWTGGAGLVMADSARTKMRTQAGISFTIRKYSQQPINTFLGFRYSFSWEQKLHDNASFATAFIFDDNLAKISDWRYEWNFNVAAPLSKKLALKTGVRILRNNRPPDLSVPLFDAEGLDTGLRVMIPRGKVDTFFTTSFVLNF
ncbi:MAG: DUF481 domain-containing protein [Candidatus Saccharicenans sp.]|nr:DUF481 domain-containing protein [Candidatus Saccharicenans sp.]